MPARDDASVCVTVQFRDRSWQVSVPEQWCRQHTTDVSQILRLACERDPHNVARASELSAYCFNKALWNAHNIEALLDERTIVLAEDVASIPAERVMHWQSVPAARILTEPQGMASQAGHLAPVFTYLGEFIENSIRALRGNGRAEKHIQIRLYLPSQTGDEELNGSAQSQDYLAFGDTGSGMTLETLQAWAKLANAPDEYLNISDCAANVEYYADGNFSCFGVGSKFAGFLLGGSMLIMTRPNDPASQILQMRVTKEDLNKQEQTAQGSFQYSASTRDPGSHIGLTPEERGNQDLMRLIKKFDEQEHGTLFIITDLNHSRTEELKAESFQTLHTYLTGTYFYLCVPGEKPARGNFIHGSGYKYGPIKFTVSAVGFTVDGSNDSHEEQVHRLGNKPWPSWPAPAPSGAEQKQEDVMHKLARAMNSSYFSARLSFLPQVHGSKFVVGINIPGYSNEKAAFAILYFHYMPNLEGRYTMEDLGLLPGVRWLPFWKGRLMQYPELKAVLPIMKQKWSDRDYRELVQKHVVVQMFLPGVVGVNSFKTQFLRPLNDQLEALPDNCYYNVDEQVLYSNTANRKELFPDGEPGHGISSERKTVLEQNFCKWLYKAQEAFDDKWVLEDHISPPSLPEGWIAFKTLRAKHKDDTYRKGEYMVVTHLGLSWYKQSNGRVYTQQKTVGRVAYFKQPADGSMTDAKVMLHREPTKIYGNELFEVSIYKLERADEKTRKEDAKRAKDSAPDTIKITFDESRVGRLQDGAEDRPIECLAGYRLPAARLEVLSKQSSSKRPGFKIIEWTSARNQNRSALVKLSVKQTVCFADGLNQGDEVFSTEAQLMEQDEEWCFVFDAPSLQLPRPGRFIAKFTVTASNRGGADFHIKKEKSIYYKASAGQVHSCSVGGMPETQQLGLPLNSLYVEFEDAHGNSCRLTSVSAIKLTSQDVVLSVEAPENWDEPEPGKHRLLLPAVSIKAGSNLTQDWFSAANQSASIGSSIEVVGMMNRQAVTVQDNFILQVLPGIPAEIVLKPQPEWFNPHAAARLPNHSTVPEFTLQLLDAAGLKTAPFAQGDRVEIRLHDDPAGDQASSLTGNQVDFDSRTGAAVFTALRVSLPAVSAAKPFAFAAAYQGQPAVSGLSISAEVIPCMNPFALRFFLDAERSRPVQRDEADPSQFVLEHTAGDTVHQLYMTVNTEAGKPLEVSDLATVKVGKKALKCERQPESAFLVHWGQLLKLPDSVRDPKDVEVQVRGKKGWHVAATITLQPISGPGVTWTLRCVTGFATARNGESLSSKVFACVEDKHHNVASLPSTFPKVLPKLTIAYQSEEQHPGLEFLGSQHRTVYNGGWQLLQTTGLSLPNLAATGPRDKILVLPDLAVVGPPGKALITISGSGRGQQQLAQGMLPFELKAGLLSCWRLNNQPSGTVQSHTTLEDMSFTACDLGGNQVDLPTGELFVELTATSTSGPMYDSAQKLVSSKRGRTLQLSPFRLVCKSSGALSLELVLRRKQQKNVRTLYTMTVDLSVVLSSQIVTSLDILHPSSSIAALTAGDTELPFRFGLQVEDGSSPQFLQSFIPKLTATLRLPDTTYVALSVELDPLNPQQLMSSLAEALTQAGTYQASLEYHDPQAEEHGFEPSEAHLKLVRTFQIKAGAAHKLGLETSLAPRKCLNAGQVVDRTVLPQTTLSIMDRSGNVVKEEGSTESIAVTIAVLDTSGPSPVDSNVVDIGTNGVEIPRADGQVRLDAICVQTARAGTPVRTAHAGNYILELSSSMTMSPAVEPVRVTFEIIEASDANTARGKAKLAVHNAKQKLKTLEGKATTRHRAVNKAGEPMRERLAQAQEILGIAVDETNWQNIQQEYQHRQQQAAFAPARPAKHCHQLSQQAKQQLRSTPGVIGFVSEFVFVEDDMHTLLLSWHKNHLLDTLVVQDSATRTRLHEANIPGVGSSPQVLLLSKVAALLDETSLPHTGTNCVLPGMDHVIRLAPHVTVNIPQERMPHCSQQARSHAMAKLKQAVVGTILCMPTELGPDGASAYSEAVFVRLNRGCPPILCQDTGARVDSSGLEGGGAGSCAPPSLDQLPGYFGKMPRQQTPAWQTNDQGLAALKQVADCQLNVAQAQAERQDADAAVQKAKADLQKCQTELEKADKQAKDLQQLLLPTDVPPLASSNGITANGANASKRSRTAAAATDQTSHSPAMVSPVRKVARTR